MSCKKTALLMLLESSSRNMSLASYIDVITNPGR
jgi:hypothetical protein